MFLKLLLLFIIMPIIELALLIKVGTYIGVIPTILIVGSTGFIGAYLARSQGFKIITKIKSDLGKGIIPTDELIGGLLILIGGVLLLTPGLLTDFTGFSLIIPGSRNRIAKYAKKKFVNYIKKNKIKNYNFNFSSRKEDKPKDYVDIDND